MYELALAIVGLLIVYEAYVLLAKQRELKNEIKKMKDDFNLEFKGPGGSVSKQRKNYPEQEHQANDDFRFRAGEPTVAELRDSTDRMERHSIAGHMNDASEMQKKAFDEEQK